LSVAIPVPTPTTGSVEADFLRMQTRIAHSADGHLLGFETRDLLFYVIYLQFIYKRLPVHCPPQAARIVWRPSERSIGGSR
jgi:hypothetical protein